MTGAARLHGRGKVRDLYDVGEEQLLLVATDRISAFDVVLPNPIPDKGRVLTGLTLFWLERTKDLVGNHLVSADRRDFPEPFRSEPSLSGRAMLVTKAQVVPVECVARGYLTGSGLKQYRAEGHVCGIPLPPGLEESSRLPEPIFTPTTKAAEGHDLPLTFDETVDLIGRGLAERLRELTIALYERGAQVAAERGIIVAVTKFEFGFAGGELILIDEVLTPDSSRFWPAEGYRSGASQPSFDKQFVRDWLDASGWDHEPPPPELPAEVIGETALKYQDAYQRVTGERFEHYRHRMGVASDRDWERCAVDLERLRMGASSHSVAREHEEDA
ncbi:MAG TPA: phosphoribosylaminoimidazolesuccinocarboxamide synthase [Actinomycetota bacterium]|nr:phosphoribosylaminoimidazolesuccinocarboxamide synthase [Actinomycetota bacterium]